MISRQVLPAAIPGIATGSILALSRAIGETAPLILIGALTFITFDPTILGPFTALPIQIYQLVRLPQEEFQLLAAAAIIVLLVILLTLNAFAICSATATRRSGDHDDRASVYDRADEPGRDREEHGDDGVANREAVFEVGDLAVCYGGTRRPRASPSSLPATPSRRSSARPAAARARCCAASTA